MISVIDDISDLKHMIGKVDQLKIIRARRVQLPCDHGSRLPPITALRHMALLSLKKPQVPTTVDPGEYTNGSNGVLTLLPQSGVKQLIYSRHLFRLWPARERGVGVYHTLHPPTRLTSARSQVRANQTHLSPCAGAAIPEMRQSGATKFPVTVPAYWWRSCAQLEPRWERREM